MSPELAWWLVQRHEDFKGFATAASVLKELIKVQEKQETKSHINTLDLLPTVPTTNQLRIRLALLHERLDQWKDASEVYKTVTETFEQDKKEARVLFAYGRALRRTGNKEDLELGIKVFGEVVQLKAVEAKDEFWKKMAQEALDNR